MNFLYELRMAARQFRKAIGFSALAVATLALGIGATTSIFSLVDQVLMRMLPVVNPNQLYYLTMHGGDTGRTSSHGGSSGLYFSYPMFRDLKAQNSAFSGLAATFPSQAGLQWHNDSTLSNVELVSGNYFDVLGVKPAIGRMFVDADEGSKNSSPIMVLSFDFWQRRFGSDPGVIGTTVLVNNHPFQIVGVVAPGFRGTMSGTAPDFYVPMNMKPQITPGWDDLDVRRSRWLNLIARLKPGLTVPKAQASLDPLWKSIREEEFKSIRTAPPDFHKSFVEKSTVTLAPAAHGFTDFADSLRKPLVILFGMVVLLAIMAAVNVAGLLLVRAAGRVREMSVRYALGATRQRVARQLLIEGLMLGIAGGICGAFLAPLISGTLLRVMFTDVTTAPLSSAPDVRVLTFDITISVMLALLFSITPVLQFWRPNVVPALKQQTFTAGGSSAIFRRAIVGVQIGMSLLLLVGAGLFIRTLHNLKHVDVGFAPDHLVTVRINPRLAGYEADQVAPLYQRMLTTLSGQPGVKSVAITDDPDLADDNRRTSISVAGRPRDDKALDDIERAGVNSTYFSTLQMPFITGRSIEESDRLGSQQVAVVNEKLARLAFGDPQQALGKTFKGGAKEEEYTIVGVVHDSKHTGVKEQVDAGYYTSIFQHKEPEAVEIYVRTYQEPQFAMSMVRTALKNLDSKLIPDSLQTMDEQISQLLINERLLAMLASGFGVLSVLMAAIGLYGVLAFSTAQRTREIGIRMALGASRVNVVKLVLREVVILSGVSIALSLPIALALGRLVRSQLYGVSAYDPVTIAGVVIAVAAAACAASFLPVRRASTVDPMSALRYE
jgi:putative ABC transport system permease protein